MKGTLAIIPRAQIEIQDDDEVLTSEELDGLLDLALKGIRKPNSLTPGQIQEIAWGLVVVARQLADKPRAFS